MKKCLIGWLFAGVLPVVVQAQEVVVPPDAVAAPVEVLPGNAGTMSDPWGVGDMAAHEFNVPTARQQMSAKLKIVGGVPQMMGKTSAGWPPTWTAGPVVSSTGNNDRFEGHWTAYSVWDYSTDAYVAIVSVELSSGYSAKTYSGRAVWRVGLPAQVATPPAAGATPPAAGAGTFMLILNSTVDYDTI